MQGCMITCSAYGLMCVGMFTSTNRRFNLNPRAFCKLRAFYYSHEYGFVQPEVQFSDHY